MVPQFDLHLLGWKAFEDLIACVFRDILGQSLQVFATGSDGGRDAAFNGTWSSDTGEKFSGSFCIQCKHTSKPGKALPRSVVDIEVSKVGRLAEAGLCDNYFLVTNHALPAGMCEEVEAAFIAAGAKQAKVYGAEWIGSAISENPRLRRLVPRLYGLGDLTQVITHQAYRQSREVLESLAPDLACFVPTAAYRQCAHALQEHGFVLLLGEPASGKTMIANLMALSAADEWNLQTLMITRPEDFSNLWNPDDPGQFLWVDDAFGATQYDVNRVKEWNQLLPKLKAAIKGKARVVFTSRDYIFAAAKRDLKICGFELFDDSRVVIQVERLTEGERQMILYSHLKAGSQPIKFKTQVKPFLEKATGVPKFLPEIARRFANPKFTARLLPIEDSVLEFFDKPKRILFDVVGALAAAEKAAIGLVFIKGGRLPIPVTADEHVAGTLELLGVTLGEVKAALVSLDDSLLKRVREGGSESWTFRHPTIRDAYATLVGSNPELIDVYLAGVTTDQMMTEVTCGGGQIEGATIVVPPSHYGLILERLEQYQGTRALWSDPVMTFLSTRCGHEVISQYFSSRDLGKCLPSGRWSFIGRDSGLEILSRLNKAGVLPEETRRAAAERIIEISEREHSCRFADSEGVKGILAPQEIDAAVMKIGKDLLENGEALIEKVRREWDEESDPDDMFWEMQRSLELLSWDERFDEEEQTAARSLRDVIDQTVQDLAQRVKKSTYSKLETEEAVASVAPPGRSIFDDVDE